MRHWIELAARLYPREWRARYGAEFDALLEDAPADWRQLWNVARKALAMQFAAYAPNLKILGAVSLAGALVAAVAAWRVPPRYVSSAVVRIASSGRSIPPEELQRETAQRFESLQEYLVSSAEQLRQTDTKAKEDPRLRLWESSERLRWSDLEGPIRRGGEIQVEPVHFPAPNGMAFRVSFAYSDRRRAQAVVQDLVSLLANCNDAWTSALRAGWDGSRQASRDFKRPWNPRWPDEYPITSRIVSVESADLPSAYAERRRTVMVAAGFAAGLLFGVLVLLFRLSPRLGVRVATCGLAGCALAAALSSLMEEPYTAKVVVRERSQADSLALVLAPHVLIPLSQWAPKAWDNLMNDGAFWKGLRNDQLRFDEASAADLYRDRRRFFQSSVQNFAGNIPGAAFEMTFRHPDRRIADWAMLQVEQQLWKHGEGWKIGTLSSHPAEVQTRYDWQLILAGTMIGILFALSRRTDHLTSINGESSLSL